MDCCQCQGIEIQFDQEYVAQKLAAYRTDGPKKTTQTLIDFLKTKPLTGKTLLDIGGGVGDIQHALLQAGVASSCNCEASTAYLEACKQESARLGHGDRITHMQGNYVEIASEVPEADIVTLDRVICCYHDMPTLVEYSIIKARQYYGIVIPLDAWWGKLYNFCNYNLRFMLTGNPFRTFVHSTAAIETIIQAHGFQRALYERNFDWQVVVYERV